MFLNPSGPALGKLILLYTRECQQTCSYYVSRPKCENAAHEGKALGATLQQLRFLGMTTIPISSANNVAAHCDFLVQERGSPLLGLRATRKLGITIYLLTINKESTHSEALSPNAYNHEIEHRSAKTTAHADFISRYAAMSPSSKILHTLLIQPLPDSREDIQRESRKSLGGIIQSLKSCWQYKSRKKFLEYFNHREDLFLCPHGILRLNFRKIVPPTLRKPILGDFHSRHLGIAEMKSHARQTAWWPELNSDIANTWKNCAHCQRTVKRNPSTWIPWEQKYFI